MEIESRLPWDQTLAYSQLPQPRISHVAEVAVGPLRLQSKARQYHDRPTE